MSNTYISRAPAGALDASEESGVHPSVQAPAPSAPGIDPTLERLLAHMAKINASDLYLTAGAPPVYRVDGVGHPGRNVVSAERAAELAESVMSDEQRAAFAATLEQNLIVATGEGRFRVNVFRQRGAVGLVVRLIRTKIPTLDELRLPAVLADIAMTKRGLVLVVGATGSGKSTTLAAMIDHRNGNSQGHIVTVEDPIEFAHPHRGCVVTQREIGQDTRSYEDALKSALRQAPDVVLIGEIRDAVTMEAAIAFAETGHLCLATLHASNANQAMERVLNFFAVERQAEIRLQLSLNLRAVVSQRLVPALPSGRAAALEILLDTPHVRELIKRGEVSALKDAMEQSAADGCCTFDSALLTLVAHGRVRAEEALRAADSRNNLRLRIERLRAGDALDAEPPLRLKSDPAPARAPPAPQAQAPPAQRVHATPMPTARVPR